MKAITFILSLVLLTTACSQQPQRDPINSEGFISINRSSFKTLLIRPEHTLSQYTQILIEPASVSYNHLNRSHTLHTRSTDFEFNEKELAKFNNPITKALANQWKKDFGWELTEKAGKNVVRARITIMYLYLFVSIKNKIILPNVVFTNENSRMQIHLTLSDSMSNLTLLTSSGIRKTGIPGKNIHSLTPFSTTKYWG